MTTQNPDELAQTMHALGPRLRAARRLLFALLLVGAIGHGVSWTLAERYLRPACTAAATERHWQSLGYRLPGPSGRRSYCVLRDAEGGQHLISANRLVLLSFLFDPWLMSFLVGLPGLLVLAQRAKRHGNPV